ncbi:dienelactone hydrolase family protein [Spirosoma luteolum]
MIHNPDNSRQAGKPLDEAGKVMVMVHGRGGSAADILSLSQYIDDPDFAFIAPEATGNTWYPYSFLRPTAENEPYLTAALDSLAGLSARLQADFNINSTQIYWLGFSQGACLLLEHVARHAIPYGGVFALSGGLIGPEGSPRDYQGSFDQTPVFLGCSDRDSHVPEERVLESERVFTKLGAAVTTRLYPNFGHTINEDELKIVNLLIAGQPVA